MSVYAEADEGLRLTDSMNVLIVWVIFGTRKVEVDYVHDVSDVQTTTSHTS